MKHKLFTIFVLLALLLALAPAQPAQAETPASPLYASGDFLWAKGMGGTSNDMGLGIAVDSSGNVYTTGRFQGTADFDPGAGTFELTSAGLNDIFVSKLDSGGNFVWAKSMGGTDNDSGYGIAVDSSGNVYTTGWFQATADFDPSASTFELTSAGQSDIFVSKLDSGGNFVWAKGMGGTNDDRGYGISVDASGYVSTTGYFQVTADFDPGAGTFNLTSAGLEDIFVSRLDSGGNFVWAKSMGGTDSDLGYSIAIDSSGSMYTTGYFESVANFDPGAGTFELTSAGWNDIFVSRLDSGGNFVWAKRMGGMDDDMGYGIAVDPSGYVYTTGYFNGASDFDPGAGISNLASAGFDDIFVSKLDSGGNFVWAKRMGGTGYDEGGGIAVDSSGNVYTTGIFIDTADFDPGAGIFNLTSAGVDDIFVSKLDNGGNFAWAKGMGGTNLDGGSGVTVDSSGYVYTTGYFNGTADFDPGAGTFNLTSAGNTDIFVSKLGANENPTDITLSNSSVAENQPIGTLVGNLTTTDPDTGDSHAYSFCGGADDATFAIAGNTLNTAAVFDFETKNTYDICLRTDDGNGGTFDKNFTVNVTDIPNVELVAPSNGEDTHTNHPTFQWNTYTGATQYLIQISTASDFSSNVTKATVKVPATSYTPKKNLLPNITYYWRVVAKVGKTYGSWSEVWFFTTGNPPPVPVLTAPGNKKTVTGSSPLFDWKDVKIIAGVTFGHYEIQISTDAGFATLFNTDATTASQYNGFILAPGTYYWRVRSVADTGDFSAWSKVRIVMIL